MAHPLYMVAARKPPQDLRAALELVKECYGCIQSQLAPFSMGFVVETERPIPEEDMKFLGVVTFE